MIKLKPYNLPDVGLLEQESDSAILTWTPDNLMIVIGNGSQLDQELNTNEIKINDIPVFKRPTGGCSVVLTPNMLAISCAIHNEKQLKSKTYFRHFNSIMIQALQNLDIKGLHHAGISDLALNNRKILGSALYRNSKMIFYHAILNIAEDPSIIENYLTTPPRMPDYRKGRSHSEFVTSLAESGFNIDPDTIKKAIQIEWDKSTTITD